MIELKQAGIKYPLTSGSLVIKENAYNAGKYWVQDFHSRKSGFANKDLIDLLLLCDGRRNSNEIQDIIVGQYHDPRDRIVQKVWASLQYLEQLGYITYADKSAHRPITFHEKSLEWSLDVVYIELTDLCNLSCFHCYAGTDSQAGRKLKTSDIYVLIDELADLGVLKIIFTGGEPLLHKDIFKILRYTKDKNIDFKLFTNGALLDKGIVEKLKALKPEAVAISLDSNRAEIHDKVRGKKCFSIVVKGIGLLKRAGIPVRINSTILKGINDKAADIEATIEFCMGLGVDKIVIGPLMSYGRGMENVHLMQSPFEAKQIAEIFKRKTNELQLKHCKVEIPSLKLSNSSGGNNVSPRTICGIGTSVCYIKVNGDVVLCPVLRGKEHCAGNIIRKKLKKIWSHSGVFSHFRTHTVETIPKCRKCSAKLKCLGGCKARALMYNDKFNSPDLWRCNTMK